MEDFMKMPRTVVCIALLAGILSAANLSAQSYSVVIGDLPGIDSLYQLIKTMGVDKGVTLDMKKAPMARVTDLIISKQADVGSPMLYLKDPKIIQQLPFDYSTAVIDKMCFIIYTNKAKPIDIANLKTGIARNTPSKPTFRICRCSVSPPSRRPISLEA
jgi:hypothetical protein